MGRYRKKPVTVEARQVPHFDVYQEAVDLETWLGGAFESWLPSKDQLVFHVAKGGSEATVGAGDWVIAEPDGSGFYPCSEADFAATYEPAGGEVGVVYDFVRGVWVYRGKWVCGQSLDTVDPVPLRCTLPSTVHEWHEHDTERAHVRWRSAVDVELVKIHPDGSEQVLVWSQAGKEPA